MDCSQNKNNFWVKKHLGRLNESAYWGVISFVGGIAWAYSTRLPSLSAPNTLIYAFILSVIVAKGFYKCTWLYAFGAALAYFNPLSTVEGEKYDKHLKLLRIERVVRTVPYFSAEVAQITPKSHCRFRLSASSQLMADLERSSIFWATVKVRPIIATKNYQLMGDYELWQRKRRVCASFKAIQIWPMPANDFVASTQRRVGHLIRNSPSQYKGVLATLLAGDRQAITTDTKDLLSRLGLGHLLAISGLHVSIIAIYAYLLAMVLLWFMPRLGLRFQCLVVLSITAMYMLTSGLDPPAIRAFLTLALLFLLRSKIITLSLADAYFILVFFIALFNPPLVVHPSAQASFTAMAIIIYYLNNSWSTFAKVTTLSSHWSLLWRNKAHVLKGVIEFQLILSLCMAWYFYLGGSDFSLLSPLANIVIIPLFTLALPLAFLWLIFAALGIEAAMVIAAFDGVFGFIVMLAKAVDSIALPQTFAADGFSWFITILALGALVSERGYLLISMGILAIISVVTPYKSTLAPGETRINIIDVGQGSAAVIDTPYKRYLVDTGARYDTGFDAGKHIVNPILNTERRAVNLGVLSHDDRDHVGGYDSIVRKWGAMPIISESNGLCTGSLNDGAVRISFYRYPLAHNDNDASCVVLIDNGTYRILLSGDIERHAEAWLVNQLKSTSNNAIDIVVVPHHGSKTSSSSLLLDTIVPNIAVVSRGLFNPYNHPNPAVMSSYEEREIDWLDTACNGGVEIRINPQQLRIKTSRKWTDSPFKQHFLKHRCRK